LELDPLAELERPDAGIAIGLPTRRELRREGQIRIRTVQELADDTRRLGSTLVGDEMRFEGT
jgi:hypothetical protein